MKAKLYKSNMYTFRYDGEKTSTNIDFVDTDTSVGASGPTVRRLALGRSEYLELYAVDDVSKCEFTHTGFDITTTGTIEFLIYKATLNNGDFQLSLKDGATQLVKFKWVNATDVWTYDNGGGDTAIDTLSESTFYIIRIDVDIAAGANGQFDCYVYDSSYTLLDSVTGIEFQNNSTTIDTLLFYDLPNVADVSYYYFDCIGITAEGGYTQGDIQYAEIDVSDYMENTRVHDGIIPYKKFFYFDCHPNYHTYFNEGDFIDVWDVNDVISFTGYIKTKSRDKNGIYKLTCHGMANEVFERTYDKSFSSDKTSDKLKDIIDNKLEFCYRDSSITATTTDYSYEYSRACIYMFNLARYMERQVVYIEPDGKVWSKDYDDLVKLSEYYLGTHNFRDDADGSEPDGWTTSNDTDCTTTIIASLDGHKKVLRLVDANAAGTVNIYRSVTQQADQTIELYIAVSDITTTTGFVIQIFETATRIIYIRVDNNDLDYYADENGGAAWHSIKDNFIVANTLFHLKIVCDDSNNQCDIYVNDALEVNNAAYENNSATGFNKIQFNTGTGDQLSVYVDAIGLSADANYNVGDNLLAGWYLYDGNQNALLIDIPGLRDSVPGYYFGNTGITSVSVRYKDNTTVIRPATPTETFKKKRLKEFRDPKIQAATEANQLGDNLYDIFSKDTIFLGMNIKGEGWLQPGRVIAIINTNQIAITAEAFLILKIVYDPQNDVHISMILSNNIITPDEFKSDLDTSSQQVHTATLQSFENQETFITQHNRDVFPLLVIAQNAHTAGANNVYKLTAYMNHGTNSKTSNKSAFWHFRLPDDYVDGEDITAVLHYLIGVGSRAVSYQWLHQYYLDGEAAANASTPSGLYTSDATADHLNIETSTITGTNLVGGTHMQIILRIQDNAFAFVVKVIGIMLKVPVNART